MVSYRFRLPFSGEELTWKHTFKWTSTSGKNFRLVDCTGTLIAVYQTFETVVPRYAELKVHYGVGPTLLDLIVLTSAALGESNNRRRPKKDKTQSSPRIELVV
ncbi:hypothetical protein AAVH_37914 [Aphelenchoides avenae]|nr:hypothetical protein AAVH_37914 [Aphelenchus avenae]